MINVNTRILNYYFCLGCVDVNSCDRRQFRKERTYTDNKHNKPWQMELLEEG